MTPRDCPWSLADGIPVTPEAVVDAYHEVRRRVARVLAFIPSVVDCPDTYAFVSQYDDPEVLAGLCLHAPEDDLPDFVSHLEENFPEIAELVGTRLPRVRPHLKATLSPGAVALDKSVVASSEKTTTDTTDADP